MSITRRQAVVHFNNGGKLFKADLFHEALEQYKKAIENDPSFYDGHMGLAKTLVKTKDYSNGVKHFKKYISLIPRNKQGSYLIDISKILIESNQTTLSISLLELSDLRLTVEQTFDCVPFLLINNKSDLALHLMINLRESTEIVRKYNFLLKDESLSIAVVEKLKKDKIVPRFFTATNAIAWLKIADIQLEDYTKMVTDTSNLLEGIKVNKNPNYSIELEKVEKAVISAQEIIVEQADIMIKSKQLTKGRRLVKILDDTKFDSVKVKALYKKISNTDKSRIGRTIRIAIITTTSIIALCIGSYFAYIAYEKSEAYDNAIRSASISGYNSFLNKYEDSEIHRLRENLLYERAVSSNTGKDINQLVSLYPLSKYLRKISISVNNQKTKPFCYGIRSPTEPIQSATDNLFLVPVGCVIGYKTNVTGNVPIEKYFTVAKDLVIIDPLSKEKTLVFKDDFKNNKNGWNLFNESKSSYGRLKDKGVKLHGESLNLYNDYRDNKFLISTIYTSKIKESSDFEIIAETVTDKSNNGTFLLFGGTKRAFNFIGFSNRGSHIYGYNNWDNSKDKWVYQSGGWQNNYSIDKGNGVKNKIKIIKRHQTVRYELNDSYIGEASMKRWYGNRIGFGVNSSTNSKIQSLEIYQINNLPKTKFIENNTYFCWVDELNVRADGTRKGQILTTIKLGEPVKYLGQIGQNEVKATFRGVLSPDYYYKIQLKDGSTGWAHGGALKDLQSEEKVDFSEFENVPVLAKEIKTVISDSTEFYMIAVYADKTRSTIFNRTEELKNKGFQANYLWIPDFQSLSGTEMYCAYIGPFTNKEQCKNKLKEVKKIYPNAYGVLASKKSSHRVNMN